MDWNESQWWDAAKNGSTKRKSASVRNRTKVYIYPSYGHFDDNQVGRAPTPTITFNNTSIDDKSLVILPGR